MTRRKQNRELEDKPALYATSEDFHRLFAGNVDSLYQLAFVLPGDHDTAEQCFVAGVEDSVHGNNVFKEWAHSWAKRTIVQLAIRALQPKPFDPDSAEDTATHGDLRGVPARHDVIGRLLCLGNFDRFVMSVLERYSEHECALLLGCTPSDVREARTRALQQITVERPHRTETEKDLFSDEVASGAAGSHHA